MVLYNAQFVNSIERYISKMIFSTLKPQPIHCAFGRTLYFLSSRVLRNNSSFDPVRANTKRVKVDKNTHPTGLENIHRSLFLKFG
mmetsp:Transcript_26919/g.56131  ORF Transcript_26919/g.56131 Transcript_26919/m.56131 type:complete len:85 (+) Transcript_26919:221-475(+)